MKKDHSLTYIDLHPQDLDSRKSSSSIGDKILWVIIWILTLCIFGLLSYISVQLELFS